MTARSFASAMASSRSRGRPHREGRRSAGTTRKHGGRGEEAQDESHSRKKAKSKWDCKPAGLPDHVGHCLELQFLYARYAEITHMLNSESELRTGPDNQRASSPPTMSRHGGDKSSAEEGRDMEWLVTERARVIAELVRKDPAFQPRSDDRFAKKLYVPAELATQELHNYDLFAAIFGSNGRTQDRLEKETGAKLFLRGRMRGKASQQQQKQTQELDLAYKDNIGKDDNEDRLHVLILADGEDSLTRAVDVVQRFLVSLKEFAPLRSTELMCRKCGEKGHDALECPSLQSTSSNAVLCKLCGDTAHSTIDCPRMCYIQGNKIDNPGPSACSSFRSDVVCRICEASGHSTIDCPKMGVSLSSVSLKGGALCRICGDGGHITIDCPNLSLVPPSKINAAHSESLSFHREMLCERCGVAGHATVDCPMLGSTQGVVMNNTHHSDILKRDVLCGICDGSGHSTIDCPRLGSYKGDALCTVPALLSSTFISTLQCRICGDGGHSAISCPMLVCSEMSELKSAKGISMNSFYQRHRNSSPYLTSGQNILKDSNENPIVGNVTMQQHSYGENLFGPLPVSLSTSLSHNRGTIESAVAALSRPGMTPGLQQQTKHINYSSSLQCPDYYHAQMPSSKSSLPPSQSAVNGCLSLSIASRPFGSNSNKEPSSKKCSLLESEYERFLSEVNE